MDWLSHIGANLTNLPNTARTLLQRALSKETPSALFLITTAPTSDRLIAIISHRLDDILHDDQCLAHTRIVASKFLLKEIVRCLHPLDAYAAYFRTEAAVAIKTTSAVAIWQRVLLRAQASSVILARAETYQKYVLWIEKLKEVMCQFVGMHMEAVEDLHAALRNQRPDDLARAIVTSCRQVSSFQNAIAQSANVSDLIQQVRDAVRMSVGNSPRREMMDQSHVAGQLGQFWNKGSRERGGKGRPGSHDVLLTLQIVQTELMELRKMSRRLRKATERELSEPWEVQRRPLRYTGLSAVMGITTRAVYTHSRWLGGSGMLEDRVTEYGVVLKGFVEMNIVEPVCRFYGQVFREVPTLASEESVAVTRSSLRDMLIDFTERNLSHVPGAEDLAKNGSMQAVMELIRQQASSPLRNSLTGSLGQAIFLQVQKLKCDVEELMLKSKQLLRAQELNLALVALVPSLLTAASLMYMVSAISLYWRSKDMDMIESTAQTARFLLGDVQSALLAADSLAKSGSSLESVMRHLRHIGIIYVKTFELEELVEKGLIRAPSKVLGRFSKDLNTMRTPGVTFESRRKEIDRMMKCYQFLQGP
eukprot:GFKZ01000875.1.p1 GENE.GFKZ01000875.1~~GFKZ01000875.1.p1  ORF type:complete len:590 (-),score=78.63 GFKZ01000875.1:819-2588(-)